MGENEWRGKVVFLGKSVRGGVWRFMVGNTACRCTSLISGFVIIFSFFGSGSMTAIEPKGGLSVSLHRCRDSTIELNDFVGL